MVTLNYNYHVIAQAGFTLREAPGTLTIFATSSCQTYKCRPKIKSYHLSAGLLALGHMVNPALFLQYVFKKIRWEPEVATFMIKTLNFSRVIHFNNIDWQKLNLEGPGPLVVNIIVNYCWRQKMLKETKTEETEVFFGHIFIIGSISIVGGPGPLGPPLATPMLRGPGPE